MRYVRTYVTSILYYAMRIGAMGLRIEQWSILVHFDLDQYNHPRCGNQVRSVHQDALRTLLMFISDRHDKLMKQHCSYLTVDS